MSRVLTLMILIASFAVSADVNASSISLRIDVAREVLEIDESGRAVRRLVPVDSGVSGEVVVYTITYTNVGSDEWDNVVITDPVASGVDYVPGSCSGSFEEFLVSVDGAKSFSTPDDALVLDVYGYERAAEPKDYTHLRWVIEESLAPGESGFVRYRARLE
jgi:uncharacterized repeat protein (TIGR01451 family)